MPPRDFGEEWPLEIGGVGCSIFHGESDTGYGVSESTGPEGRHALVYFQCYWADRFELMAGLLGTVDYVAGTIVRTPPASYPVMPADVAAGTTFENRLFCTAIQSITGTKMWRDDDGNTAGLPGWSAYTYAVVAAEFTSPPYLVADLLGPGIMPNDPSFNDLTYQTYIISKVQISGEVFAPPTGSFVFGGAGAFANTPLLDVGASQIRTRFEIVTTRVRMPLVPMQVITAQMNTVNTDPFLVGAQSFPKGSVLFTGVKPEPRSDPCHGGIIWDVDYCFMANGPAAGGGGDPLDWNYFLDPTGQWTLVQTRNGDPVFRYGDHVTLFMDVIS